MKINSAKIIILFIIVNLSLLISAASATSESSQRDPREFFFTETFGDLSEELEQAKENGQQGLLLFYEFDSCPYCHMMLENVLNQKSVQDWYKGHFLNLSIDIYGDVEITDFAGESSPSKIFAEKQNIVTTPTIIFYDLKGKEIYRRIGSISEPAEFLKLGEFVVGKFYEKMSFKYYRTKYKPNK